MAGKFIASSDSRCPALTRPLKRYAFAVFLLINKKKVSGDDRNTLMDLVSYHWMRVYASP
jgi:hypothetical protein